jgi:formamidopyrimidine-DNA glycosylase
MPELPDLEVFSHNLQRKLKGKTLERISLVNRSKSKVSEQELNDTLSGKKLHEVYREGKELRFSFGNDAILGMHLMLHGKLEPFDGKTLPKHTIVGLHFKDDSGLALTDYQGAANASLNPAISEVPDAVSKEMTVAYLQARFAKSRSAVKKVLLDQHVIRGIGNAYADEILWEARIAPASIASKIPGDKIKDLVKAIGHVLKHAQQQIVKKDPDIISGEVRDFMLIHNSRKTHSPNGSPIHTEMINSRKTYYTEEQELYK